jgi:biopolymer transport protein ExbD
MKVPSRTTSGEMELNLTPMIDVVFLLNIFFLVATYSIQSEQHDPVELAAAQQAVTNSPAVARLIVTVRAAGDWVIGGRTVTTDELRERLSALVQQSGATPELYIRCDRQSHYRDVEPLLRTAVEQGLTRIRFAVLKGAPS